MTGTLEGKLVLITGASIGIGRAAAREFAREGAKVIAIARSEEQLQSLVDELGGPPGATAIRADVTDRASMEAMAERVLDQLGVPDVIVANAGIGLDALFTETPEESMRQVFEVNVFGVVRTVQPFLPRMIQRGSGRVLLISSVVGKRAIPHYSAYSASKFALHGIAEALRSELLGTGVSIGVVCPSSTESEFHARKLRHGPPQNETRLGKHSAESVARGIVRMARSRRRELVLSPEGKLMSLVNKIAPGLVDRIVARLLMRRSA